MVISFDLIPSFDGNIIYQLKRNLNQLPKASKTQIDELPKS